MPGGLGRLVLVDASGLSDDDVAGLLLFHPGLKVWYHGRADAAQEEEAAAKLAALQQARDLRAIGEDEYCAAVARLLPDPLDQENHRYKLLAAAFEAGALTDLQFREAVGRLHLTMGYEVGDRIEFRDPHADWGMGTITKFAADARGQLQVHIRPDGAEASHCYEHIRRPVAEGARREVDELREELAKCAAERAALQEQVGRYLAEARGGGMAVRGASPPPPRVLLTPTAAGHGRYELYGFCFGVASTTLVHVTSVTFGTRITQSATFTVYASTQGLNQLRQDASKWTAVAHPRAVAPSAPDAALRMGLETPVVVQPGKPVQFLVHSPHDIQAVVYHRAEAGGLRVCARPHAGSGGAPMVTAEDGCVQILAGDAAQASRQINNTHAGFAFCGALEYSVADAVSPDASDAAFLSTPAPPPHAVPIAQFSRDSHDGASHEPFLPAQSLARYSRASLDSRPPLPLSEGAGPTLYPHPHSHTR
eukprot:TRINITY_DN7939_c0_g1_i4.p1 TRINITY_DN7939_c0_g1~~TRINITY_DN7939_c0_g1_i4.p1  ORF type:complete len:479 (+),score=102.03 TRINITY_DN7939_c0_g1_i4:239-1675(+)